jgi:hypothetical protein
MTTIHISKLDAAKRELEHAIRLFFLSGDPVVIHLVIYSSQQILRDLARSKGLSTFIDEMIDRVKPEYKKYLKGKLASSYNFFHHADKDPTDIKEFNPEINEYALWECVDLYSTLTKETTGIMKAFRFWFFIKNNGMLLEQKDKEVYLEVAKKVDLNNKAEFLELAEQLENRRTV